MPSNSSAEHRRIAGFDASCVVPRLSTVAITTAGDPENEALKKLMLEAPANPAELRGKRIAIIATDGVEELELTVAHKWFLERGATAHLVSPRRPQLPAKFGVEYPAIRETHILTVRFMENAGWFKIDRFIDQVGVDDYDAIMVPGGGWNPLSLRNDPAVVKFIAAFAATGKTTAAICHGPMVFINAGLLKGRNATSFWDIHQDLRNAGANWSDVPLVVDGNLITSRFIYDLPPFLTAIAAAVLR
ncbi:MAG: DJ-1/PfpI family protein [Planctomycetota bacterium]|nr:DJ-1/PfpI family protein [Planctomycetota bacterium]